ncbi:hypothetical protein [Rickettsiella massiliensis]|uniref:hypothetical protein n=1 Tax=Rickettsiella massiliensis TaxID=676517 RepID=UPI00031956EF|nr:hypothetical protein [Rickettsiella massiliensis]
MKTHNLSFNRDSEFRLTQKLDRLEASLYKVKWSFLKWSIGLAFILIVSEGLIYSLFN